MHDEKKKKKERKKMNKIENFMFGFLELDSSQQKIVRVDLAL